MSERELRERILEGMAACLPVTEKDAEIGCKNCPYGCCQADAVSVPLTMLEDVRTLLKAQEPRVLTLDEYRAIAEKPRSMREPVWIEWRDGGYGWAIPQRAYELYGVDWLAWTDRPTDEMREATAWA